ncbi:MAG: hypothetical protein LBL83_06145, partial [Clostridiales bacterium]|nr:hypothetical protein [Clostridiales bacterium]
MKNINLKSVLFGFGLGLICASIIYSVYSYRTGMLADAEAERMLAEASGQASGSVLIRDESDAPGGQAASDGGPVSVYSL